MSTPFRDILKQLVLHDVRFVIVGGIAVILHGHLRVTKDLDLVVDLHPSEARKAIQVLAECGLQPLVPVDPLAFADPAVRRGWIEEKNMKVFQMRDPRDLRCAVDVFVEHPIPFEELWQRSELLPLGDVTVRVASIRDLIEMKRMAARPGDFDDIAHLEVLERGRDQSKE